MEKREGKHWLNGKKAKLNLCTKTLGEHFFSLFICLPSQFGRLFSSHFHTINWITQFHRVPEMGSCCIPSFPSSIFPLTFCLSRSDPVTLTVISGWSAGWGLFCELPTLAKCDIVWGKPTACVLATPLGNVAWSPQAREDRKRISREATENNWDGFTIWISFSHIKQGQAFSGLWKNRVQTPGFRSQARGFFGIWSRRVHTLYVVEEPRVSIS